MPGRTPARRRPVLATIVAVATIVACSNSTSSDETLPPVGPPDAPPPRTPAPASTPAPPSAPAPTTLAPTTSAAPTTVPPTTNAPTTNAPTTVVPTTLPPPTPPTAAPTTTAPPNPELSLALGRDGLGEAAFGIPATAALTEMTALLGEPDDDTGWVDPFAISSCAGTVVRRVSWGSLSLLLGDESPFAHGRRHLYGFGYGTVDAAGIGPPGLLTPEGIGLGSAVADLRQAYGEVTVDPGEPGLIDASFYVDDALRGLLTGGEPEDTVTVIFGGQYCA